MSNVRADLDVIGSITRALGPVSIASSTNTLSSAIDMTGKPGWKVLLIGSTGTYTDGTFTFSLQSSATSGGTYAAETPVSGSLAALSAGSTMRTASFVPTKPFLKVNVLSSGVTSGALCDAYVVLLPPSA